MTHLVGPFILSALLMTAACASTPDASRAGEPDQISQAISEPFRDLNLVREQQAAVLTEAAAQPYAAPDGCAVASEQLAALNAALGPDIDAPARESSEAAQFAGNTIAGAVSDVVRLPFRGVVRRVTGAEKREKTAKHAMLAGGLRRAYLKGFVDGACPDVGGDGSRASQ